MRAGQVPWITGGPRNTIPPSAGPGSAPASGRCGRPGGRCDDRRRGRQPRRCRHLAARRTRARSQTTRLVGDSDPGLARRPLDLADVLGQPQARLATEVCAAGGHHLSLVGPPGVGKTMLAERLPGIFPPLSTAEALEVSSIRSIARHAGDWTRASDRAAVLEPASHLVPGVDDRRRVRADPARCGIARAPGDPVPGLN